VGSRHRQRKFQKTHKLPTTGKADSATLKKLEIKLQRSGLPSINLRFFPGREDGVDITRVRRQWVFPEKADTVKGKVSISVFRIQPEKILQG
jgi:hypothetical protein